MHFIQKQQVYTKRKDGCYMKIMPENLYARNIKQSYEWFSKLQQASRYAFPMHIWNQLYDKNIKGKDIKTIEELDLTTAKRTAIILVGLSGCGKSSYAYDFIKKYPNFKWCRSKT